MIPILAWRNIWRNPSRSMVVILAIAVGIWADLFVTGFALGMVQNFVESNIARVVGHLQIHHPEYQRDREVRFHLEAPDAILDSLAASPEVRAFSPRTLVTGMISAPKGSRGVVIKGVNPEKEAPVTALADYLDAGTYFEPDRKNQILLGKALADKLQVKLRSKIVLTFQDMEGNITTGAFRVSGIFASGNTPYEEANVFVQQDELSTLLVAGTPEVHTPPIHEIAIICTAAEAAFPLQKTLQQDFPTLQTENYREIAPDLQLYESTMGYISLVYLSIILLALIFGITNTMLMAVLERIRELGMLMAIGLSKGNVFLMIVLETLFLSLVGAPIGLLLGAWTIRYFGIHGIDLSKFAQSLHEYGLGTKIYFAANAQIYWQTPLLLMLTALLAAIYPALKAIRLKPSDAIRKL